MIVNSSNPLNQNINNNSQQAQIKDISLEDTVQALKESISELSKIIDNKDLSNKFIIKLDKIAPGFFQSFKYSLYNHIKPHTNDPDWAANNMHLYPSEFANVFEHALNYHFIDSILFPFEMDEFSYELNNEAYLKPLFKAFSSLSQKEQSLALKEYSKIVNDLYSIEVNEKYFSPYSIQYPVIMARAIQLTRDMDSAYAEGKAILADVNLVRSMADSSTVDAENISQAFVKRFDKLSIREQNYFDLRIYQLSKNEKRDNPEWGKLNRWSNIDRTALAMRDTLIRRSSNAPVLKDMHVELMKAMKVFHSCMKQMGVKYCANGGTLLGSVRHKNIIPHDDDIDVAIHVECLAVLRSPMFKKIIEDQGFELIENSVCWKFQKIDGIPTAEEEGKYKFPWIDIFTLQNDPFQPSQMNLSNLKARSNWPNEHYTREEWESIKELPFGDTVINSLEPQMAQRYLNAGYGPNWHIQMYAVFDHMAYKTTESVPYYVEPLED